MLDIALEHFLERFTYMPNADHLHVGIDALLAVEIEQFLPLGNPTNQRICDCFSFSYERPWFER